MPRAADLKWTGPRPDDLDATRTRLLRPMPGPRWPYGPPSFHETCCILFAAGLFCDCKASDASDSEYGDGTYDLDSRA